MGTAIDDQGTIYLLHERTMKRSGDVHYYFVTGDAGRDHAIIDHREPDRKQRLRVVARDPSDLAEDRYVLPTEWHSYGMQAWSKDHASAFPERKGMAVRRLEGASADRPLSFHLDDAVLGAGELDVLEIKNARIALFDHLLHIREPDRKRPHVWRGVPTRNYLPAEYAVYVDGQGLERVTRLVYQEGHFYDLRDKRVRAGSFDELGVSPCVGARLAVANDFDDRHVMISYMQGNPTMPPHYGQEIPGGMGRAQFHMIDTSFLRHDFPDGAGGTVSTRLVHLLVFLPVHLDGTKVTPAEIETMLPALNRAAEWWDQNHPGHPRAPAANTAPVTVGLVPATGSVAGAKVVRIRHYFGEAPEKFPDVHTIRVRRGPGGAWTSAKNRETTLHLGDIDLQSSGGNARDVDQDPSTARFVLPHELAHAMGHPDDYEEGLAGHDGAAAWNMNTIAGATARPFDTDRPALDYWGRHPKGAPPARTGRDCFVRIVRSRSEPHPFLWPVPPLEPKLTNDEINAALLCYALGAPTFDEDPTTGAKTLRTALRASDFDGLASVVSRLLKDVLPHRRIVRLAPCPSLDGSVPGSSPSSCSLRAAARAP